MNDFKLCSCCKILQPVELFYIVRANKDGLGCYCKLCHRQKRLKNIEELRQKAKQKYRKDIQESRRKNNEYKHKIASTLPPPPEKKCSICQNVKLIENFYKCQMRPDGYDVRCKDCERSRKREFHNENKEKLNKKCSDWWKNNRVLLNERIRTNPNKNIQRRMRARIWNALKKDFTIKNKRTQELTGCNFEFLRNYLESKFKLRYNYELDWNEFCVDDKFAIDHVIPCESFDLQQESAQKFCFHYSNLQILPKEENDKKSDFLFGQRARWMKTKLTGNEDFLKLKDWNQKIISCK